MKTGNTEHADRRAHEVHRASMEPGHEDREYIMWWTNKRMQMAPQWSPVMKTGNTESQCTFQSAVPSLNGARS